MTNSWRSFGADGGGRLRSPGRCSLAAAIIAALLAGCEPQDGLRELTEGRRAFEAGDLKRATKLLSESAELAPTNVDVCVSLAQVMLANGELSGARTWIDRAEALAAGDLDVRLLAAQIAWHEQDYAKAETLFRGIADDESLEPAARADGWTGLGIVQKTCNEHDLARISFLRAIRLDRRNASARYHLGHVYRDAPFGYPEVALEQFDAFIHLSGEEMSSRRVQRTQETIIPGLKETIQRTAAERPGASNRNCDQSQAALTRAETAFKKGNWKTARAAYQESLAADPLSYPAALGIARSTLKLEPTVAGQKKALDGYRLACSLKPSAIATLIEAGQLAEKLALPVQAREIYSRAVAANPASLDAVDGLIRSIRKANGDRKIWQAYQAYRDILPVPGRRK